MSSITHRIAARRDERTKSTPNALWTRRCLIALTVLAWLLIAGIVLVVVSKIAGPMIYLLVSALLAYVLYPAVRAMQRFMPRPVAIFLVFLALVGGLIVLSLTVVISLVRQIASLIANLQQLVQSGNWGRLEPVVRFLESLGVSPTQFQLSAQQLAGQLQGVALTLGLVVATMFSVAITALLIGTLTVYFLVDGPRVLDWLRHKTPLRYRERVGFYFDTLDHMLGRFIRGNILLACLMSVLIGVGAALIGVPFPFLLAIVVFVFEFVPVVGSYISGGFGILLAFTQGWQTGVMMIVLTVLVQGGLDGQILVPRILGKAVGLHPILSIVALITGASLFGFIGALFALPVAGILQLLVVAWWASWRTQHPDQFPEGALAMSAAAGATDTFPQDAASAASTAATPDVARAELDEQRTGTEPGPAHAPAHATRLNQDDGAATTG